MEIDGHKLDHIQRQICIGKTFKGLTRIRLRRTLSNIKSSIKVLRMKNATISTVASEATDRASFPVASTTYKTLSKI